jgi:hypothetical protein
MEPNMTKSESHPKTKRWTGEATDLDRYFAAHDPRQMHFTFYAESEASVADFRSVSLPIQTSEPLAAAA